MKTLNIRAALVLCTVALSGCASSVIPERARVADDSATLVTADTGAPIGHVRGKSQYIEVESTPEVKMNIRRIREERLMLLRRRISDCADRAQFAGMAVKVRDQLPADRDVVELLKNNVDQVWRKIEAKNPGKTVPTWYKLEYHRVINDMLRRKPTDYVKFAGWWGTQCTMYGPWLDPEAQ